MNAEPTRLSRFSSGNEGRNRTPHHRSTVTTHSPTAPLSQHELPRSGHKHPRFYFDTRLSWKHHVEVACNRARASLKALQLLASPSEGSTKLGGDWPTTPYLPVLTYSCQLWFTGKQVTLVKKLQTVQNDT